MGNNSTKVYSTPINLTAAAFVTLKQQVGECFKGETIKIEVNFILPGTKQRITGYIHKIHYIAYTNNNNVIRISDKEGRLYIG